jgi:hypothetical protein
MIDNLYIIYLFIYLYEYQIYQLHLTFDTHVILFLLFYHLLDLFIMRNLLSFLVSVRYRLHLNIRYSFLFELFRHFYQI